MKEDLLRFYDELNDHEKTLLNNQIDNIDFDFYKKLYERSKIDEIISSDRISKLSYYSKEKMSIEEKNKYIKIGENLIRNGKVCTILLAGGMGSRLGIYGPKGTYELDLKVKKSLFEIMCDKLIKIKEKYGVYLKWFIMTSKSNNNMTIEFFKKNNYFNYPKDKIIFFTQDTLNILDLNGNMVLENKYTVKNESNGNGDIFNAFKKNNLNSYLNEIEWISIYGIDNILLDIVDPLFIGLSSFNNTDIASKSIKKNITDSDYVFAKVDNKPCLVSSIFLDNNMKNSNDYNQVNILSHLFKKDAFIKCEDIELQYHRAFKKNKFLDKNGNLEIPDSPNSFKFEKFIFDVFPYFDDMTLLEVEKEKEFSPIKSLDGEYTPKNAIELYEKN